VFSRVLTASISWPTSSSPRCSWQSRSLPPTFQPAGRQGSIRWLRCDRNRSSCLVAGRAPAFYSDFRFGVVQSFSFAIVVTANLKACTTSARCTELKSAKHESSSMALSPNRGQSQRCPSCAPCRHRRDKHAYGRAILKEVQRRLNRDVSAGAVYATLERLEVKGLASSRLAPGTALRGGRARRYFKPTGAGVRALNAAKSARIACGRDLPGR
jgi:Transcriptional regulator PadR-like family